MNTDKLDRLYSLLIFVALWGVVLGYAWYQVRHGF